MRRRRLVRGESEMSQQTRVVVEETSSQGAGQGACPGEAKLVLDGKEHELPVVVGSEGERAVDITHLRAETGYITLDSGYGNTGACESAITFIDGERGILRYRGYDIEDIASRTTFVDVCYLLIYGHLPSQAVAKNFREELTYHSLLHHDINKVFDAFPA